MEWELRIILGAIGLAIIGFVAFDGWRRSKPKRSREAFDPIDDSTGDSSKTTARENLDREGFDRDGVSEVRRRPLMADEIEKSDGLVATADDHLAVDLSDNRQKKRTPSGILGSKYERPKKDPAQNSELTDDREEQQELIFSLTLSAYDEKPFSGSQLLALLVENGCRFGDMNIFHRHKSAQDTTQHYFSVANAFNPGVFDLDAMASQTFRAISFFMAVPGSCDPEIGYETMVNTARQMQKELSGKLLDSTRSAFTEQTHQHQREQIKEYKRRHLVRS